MCIRDSTTIDAIILKSRDYREQDKLLTYFALETGKGVAIARGAAKPGGKLRKDVYKRQVISIGLKVDDGSFLHLAGAQESPYENYSVSEETESMLTWRKTWPTVEIVVRNISELVTIVNEYSAEESQIIARERAEDVYKRQTPWREG